MTQAAEAMESNKRPRPKRPTQQAYQDGRNGQTKAGPSGGKERDATWDHTVGPMDSIQQDSITQAIIARGKVMATRIEQQSTID